MPAGYAQGYSDYYNRKEENEQTDITQMSEEDKRKFAIRKRLQKMKLKKKEM